MWTEGVQGFDTLPYGKHLENTWENNTYEQHWNRIGNKKSEKYWNDWKYGMNFAKKTLRIFVLGNIDVTHWRICIEDSMWHSHFWEENRMPWGLDHVAKQEINHAPNHHFL